MQKCNTHKSKLARTGRAAEGLDAPLSVRATVGHGACGGLEVEHVLVQVLALEVGHRTRCRRLLRAVDMLGAPQALHLDRKGLQWRARLWNRASTTVNACSRLKMALRSDTKGKTAGPQWPAVLHACSAPRQFLTSLRGGSALLTYGCPCAVQMVSIDTARLRRCSSPC